MTVAPTAPTERPTLLKAAVGLLLATAAMSVIFAVLGFAFRNLTTCSLRVSTTSKLTSAQQVDAYNRCRAGNVNGLAGVADSAVSHALVSSLVYSVVFGALFVLLAVLLWRVRPIARWSVVGYYVLATLGGLSSFGAQAIPSALAGSTLPVAYRIVLFIGGLTFVGAVVLVNLKPVTTVLNLNRPVRTVATRGAGNGLTNPGGAARPVPSLRTMFFPRAGAGPRDAADAGATPPAPVDLAKAPPTAAARSAAAAGSAGKAKGRASDAGATAVTPATTRPRGKSRKA